MLRPQTSMLLMFILVCGPGMRLSPPNSQQCCPTSGQGPPHAPHYMQMTQHAASRSSRYFPPRIRSLERSGLISMFRPSSDANPSFAQTPLRQRSFIDRVSLDQGDTHNPASFLPYVVHRSPGRRDQGLRMPSPDSAQWHARHGMVSEASYSMHRICI